MTIAILLLLSFFLWATACLCVLETGRINNFAMWFYRLTSIALGAAGAVCLGVAIWRIAA